MKCPICDHKTNYRSHKRFITHLKKHEISETTAFRIWEGILQMCPHCLEAIPMSCVGCINCGKPVNQDEPIP